VLFPQLEVLELEVLEFEQLLVLLAPALLELFEEFELLFTLETFCSFFSFLLIPNINPSKPKWFQMYYL
jgi:hypothetical protein